MDVGDNKLIRVIRVLGFCGVFFSILTGLVHSLGVWEIFRLGDSERKGSSRRGGNLLG